MMRTRGHHRQLRREPVVRQRCGERVAHVVHEDQARYSVEPRLLWPDGAREITPARRAGDPARKDRRSIERRGPSLERSLRQHPRRVLPGVADPDTVLGVPELAAVATHLGVDGVVAPLDLGSFGHATNLASSSVGSQPLILVSSAAL